MIDMWRYRPKLERKNSDFGVTGPKRANCSQRGVSLVSLVLASAEWGSALGVDIALLQGQRHRISWRIE